MDIEKFTERARGFIQSAQSLALREGNQQFTPEHLLKVLIDDEEGLAARLITAAGGSDRPGAQRRGSRAEEAAQGRRAARARSIWRQETARLLDNAEQIAKKAGDSFVTAEYLLLALALATGTECGAHPEGCRRHRPGPEQRDRRSAPGPHRRQRHGRERL